MYVYGILSVYMFPTGRISSVPGVVVGGGGGGCILLPVGGDGILTHWII